MQKVPLYARIAVAVIGLQLMFVGQANAAAKNADGDKVFDNVGSLLDSAATNLWKVLGVVAIILALRKKTEAALIFFGVAIIAGGFVYAQSSVAAVIKAIWTTLASGV